MNYFQNSNEKTPFFLKNSTYCLILHTTQTPKDAKTADIS